MEFPAAATVGGRLKKCRPALSAEASAGREKFNSNLVAVRGATPYFHFISPSTQVLFATTRRAHSSAVNIKLYNSIYKLAFSGATPKAMS